DRSGRAHALRQLGRLAQEVGDFAAAERTNTEALELFRSLGEWHQVGHVLDQLGEALAVLGYHNRAERTVQEALRQLENAGCEEGVSSALSHMARLAHTRGDPGRVVALAVH